MNREQPKGVVWSEFLVDAERRLENAGIDQPGPSARAIVEECSGYEGAEFFLGLGETATVSRVNRFEAMMERRLAGEPIQYVIGHWSFRLLDLAIDRRVLIPRPETETVAERAIGELARLSEGARPVVAADLGAGSGAIGLSLAFETNVDEVWLTDLSADAVAVIRSNLAGLGSRGGRVRVAQGSWFEALPPDRRGQFGVIVSNPPYVTRTEPLPDSVADWEPDMALRADEEGTAHLIELVVGAPGWLRPDGSLVLEMAPTQTGELAELASRHFAEVEIHSDLSGRERSIVARHPKRH